jgi:hypothetical protein
MRGKQTVQTRGPSVFRLYLLDSDDRGPQTVGVRNRNL